MKFIKSLVLLFLFLANITKSQVSVYGRVDHLVPDGIDTLGNITLTVSGSTSPYTYTWNPGAINTKDISNIHAGQYTLNVLSTSSQTYTTIYNLGYKVNWTNLDHCTFTNDTLASTGSASIYSRAISKNTLAANTDGWLEYVITNTISGSGYVGFVDSISPNTNILTDIDYGLYYYLNTTVYAYDGGTNKIMTTDPKVGDVLRIERIGDTINYKINGTVLRTLTVSGVGAKTLKLKAALIGGCKFINMGCSFNQAGNGYFPNCINTFPLIKHLENTSINNGSIELTPEVAGSHTYTWQPSGANTSSITSQAIGQYKISIEDSLHNISSKYYNIGYKVNWTNLDRCTFVNDSLVPTGTNVNSQAVSKNTLASNTDGWFEYIITPTPSGNGWVGFTDSISPNINTLNDIDYGFNYYQNVTVNSFENGSGTVLTSASRIGDVLRVERIGNTINYKINGVILKTLTVSGLSAKTLKLKAALINGLKFVNIGCSFDQSGQGLFPNYINDYPLVKHLTGTGTNDGSIAINPVFSGAYTYTWQPSGTNSNPITNQSIGKYKVNIEDSVHNITSKYYNIGYKVNWTNLDRCYFRNDSLVSTTGNAAIFSNAVSKNTLLPNIDGWFEYVLSAVPNKYGYFGFTDSISPIAGKYNDIDYGLYFSTIAGYIGSYENGNLTWLSTNAKIGDVIRIERIGDVIKYKINDVILKTTTVSGLSQKVLKLKASCSNDLKVLNFGCSFYQDSNVDYQNFIEVIPLIKHSSGQGINDGSMSVTPKLSGLQSYSWQPSNQTVNPICSLFPGSNTVTITDSISNQSSYTYNAGYKTVWTGVTNGFFRNDTLKATTITTVSNYAFTKNILSANTDGWFEYVIPPLTSYNNYIGFVDSAANNSTILTDIQYGFYYQGSVKYLNAYESGTSSILSHTPRTGDIVRIERIGNTISYKINGVVIKTITNAAIGAKVFKLKAKLYYQNYLTHVGISESPCYLNVSAGSTPTITCTNPTALLSGTSTVSGVSYSWVPGGSTPTNYSTTVSGAGTYTLKVTDASGCSSAATVAVISNTAIPPLSITNSPTITALNPTVTLTGTSTTSGISYSWAPGGTTPTSNTTSVSSGGVYTLTVTDSINGCVNSATVLVVKLSVSANITDYENDTLKGIANLTIMGGTPPYNVAWNGLKLPTPFVAYHNLIDSIPGMVIDSVQFKQMIDSLRQRTVFNDLEPGTYSITVYDQNNDSALAIINVGAKITSWGYNLGVTTNACAIANKVINNINYNYGTGECITQQGTYSAGNHFAIPLNVIDLNTDNQLSFVIPDNNDISYVGIHETKSEINGGTTDINERTMFKFNGNGTFDIMFQSQSIYNSSFSSGDNFSLKTNLVTGKISYYKNEVLLIETDYAPINTASSYMPKVVLGKSGSSVSALKIIGPKKDKKTITGQVTDVTCDNICSGTIQASGKIVLGIPKYYEIYRSGETTPFSTITAPLLNSVVFQNLCPGVYSIKYYADVTDLHVIDEPAITYVASTSQIFEVAYMPDWINNVNISINNLDRSLTKNVSAPIEWNAGASSYNTLMVSSVKTEWIEWTSNGINAVGLSGSDPDINLNSINYGIGNIDMSGFHWCIILRNGALLPFISCAPGDKFRIEKTGTSILYKKNNVQIGSAVVSPNANLIVDASLYSGNINHPRLSFGCNLPPVFVSLKKELDGTYFQTANNKLLFTTDGDYSNANITYSIYNFSRTSFTTLPISSSILKNGDNRHEINITSLVPGYYVLELINQKKEKLMLRFKK